MKTKLAAWVGSGLALGMSLNLMAVPVLADVGHSSGAPLPTTNYDKEENENISVYDEVSPAVVSITSGKNEGAGVILTPDGVAVTNKHVLAGATSVAVKMPDGQVYKAQLIGLGTLNKDLAFIKITGGKKGFPCVRMGDSAGVKVGQRVLAIGSPFGLDGTLTTGIVSRIDHDRNMLQTDAAINPGNSGGPLLNAHGELIGINRSIVNPVGASSAGISFAVPVNVVRQELYSIGLGSSDGLLAKVDRNPVN